MQFGDAAQQMKGCIKAPLFSSFDAISNAIFSVSHTVLVYDFKEDSGKKHFDEQYAVIYI